VPAGSDVHLDLSAATYLASAGVGMVLQLRAEAADKGIRLRLHAAPGTPSARVIALAGLGDSFDAGVGAASGEEAPVP
jgi:anti-anti-sigma regulatory factor